MKYFLSALLLFCVLNANAQFFIDSRYNPAMFVTNGYAKVGSNSLGLKFNIRTHCSAYFFPNSYVYPVSQDSVPVTTTLIGSSPLWRIAIMMRNVDTQAKATGFATTGVLFSPPLPGYLSSYGQTARLVNKNGCINCLSDDFNSGTRQAKFLSTMNEYVTDTSLSFVPILPNSFNVDPGQSALTIYNSVTDIFGDTMAFYLKNVPPPFTTIRRQSAPFMASMIYSRMFRYQDYASINSPEPTNRNIIAALQGRTINYSFGYVDKEADSIRVTPLQWQLSKRHPVLIGNVNLLPTDTIAQRYFRGAIKDSVYNLAYRSGYSYTNPFGPGSSYTLDPATGDISFTAPDTGLYFLAYRVSEYRDGRPLGDIMTHRVAYVIDSTGIILPTISQPTAINGGSYDTTAKLIVICPGQTLNFNVGAGSTLAGSKIKLETNLTQSCPGSTVSITGQGTMTPNLTFNWTPTLADAGYHYVFVSAIDTACGPGHKPVSVSRGFRILVRGKIDIGATDSVVCGNRPVKLYLTSGAGQGAVTWSTLTGGDPQQSCLTCDTLSVTPDSTTRYVATINSNGCVSRDTFRVRVNPLPTVSTITTNVIGYTHYFGSNAQNATNYSWTYGNGNGSGSATPTYTYNTNGTYTVRLIVSNACGSDTAFTTITIKGVGVINVLNEKDIIVYPNPASSLLVIKNDSKLPIKTLTLIDATGATVRTLKPVTQPNKETTIDLKGTTAGVYSLQVEVGNEVVVKRVVVK